MPEEKFTEENGEIKFTPDKGGDGISEKVDDAMGPFSKMTEQFIGAIETGMQDMSKDDSKVDTKEMILIVLGAMSFTVAHYYTFLKKMGVVKDLDSFMVDLDGQIRRAVKTFEKENKDGKGHKK
jgi:hypothetical protein